MAASRQLIPVQVGAPSDYAQSRRGWLIVVLSLQTAAATFSLCTPMLSLAGAVHFTDVTGGALLAVAVFFGYFGWQDNMTISYLFMWLWLCFTYLVYSGVAGAYSFSQQANPETLPTIELAARVSSLSAAALGLSLGWLIYDDYQAEHPGQDMLGQLLLRLGIFSAPDELPLLRKTPARRNSDPPLKRPGDSDDGVSPFRALFTWEPPELPATAKEPWPIPNNQGSNQSSLRSSIDRSSSAPSSSPPAPAAASAGAVGAKAAAAPPAKAGGAPTGGPPTGGPFHMPGGSSARSTLNSSDAGVDSFRPGGAARTAGPAHDPDPAPTDSESASGATLSSSPDVTARTASTMGNMPSSSRFATSARPAFPFPTPRSSIGSSLAGSGRPSAAGTSARPYERYDL